jgi:hypothetical protein
MVKCKEFYAADMEVGRWDHIDELFHQAADLPLSKRSAFLDATCRRDSELRSEVEPCWRLTLVMRLSRSPCATHSINYAQRAMLGWS